ncbi:DUF4872 domain-containing protein [Dactylosporangium sp. NPDC000521]|uniref:BtrH N-terminal domain-containing protein n=1 Tax=Dactylosporangium sp. NPDC000521 TaxID=3363975 RepID=UPI0036A98765
MTDHKHLKRLVRERSTRTGESYTTARRRVVAARTAARPPQHQPSDLVRRLLLAAGTGLSEPMVCGLGGGIGFMAAVFDYRGMPPILTVVAQHHPAPWAPTVLARLGVPFTESRSTAPAAALKALRLSLAGGRPVYCTVTASRLPWRTVTVPVDADPHGILVMDEHPDGFAVHDDGPRRLPVDAFMEAWSAHRKGRHHRLVVTDGTPTVPLSTAIRAALAETTAHLTGPVLGNAFDANFGFAGMTRLASQLRDTRTKAGFVRRFAEPSAFAFVLRRLHECLEEQHTAPGATRPLYAEFLDEAAALTGHPHLTEAASAFRSSAAVWSAMATTARQSSTADPTTVFTTLADLLDHARTIEEAAIPLLQPPA